MLDESAIKLIQQTAVNAATAHHPLNTDKPTLLAPDGVHLVDIEHLQAGRSRFRGSFSTNQLAEFIAYTSHRRETADPVQVFVAAERGHAQAYFNLGNVAKPGHGDDVGSLQLQHTAAQVALLQIADKPQTQKGLSDWLEDWADIVVPIYGGEIEGKAPPLSQAINAIRDITIAARSESSHQERNFGASRTALEEIEAKGKLTLPTGFYFACAPYEGFLERTWNLRLSVLTDADKPKLVLRIVGRQDVEERIAQEFEQKLREALPTCQVFRGSFRP